MIFLANFQPDPFRQFGRQPEARSEDPDDQRVAGFGQFHPSTNANAQGFETLDVFIFAFDPAHNAARADLEPVQTRLSRENEVG